MLQPWLLEPLPRKRLAWKLRDLAQIKTRALIRLTPKGLISIVVVPLVHRANIIIINILQVGLNVYDKCTSSVHHHYHHHHHHSILKLYYYNQYKKTHWILFIIPYAPHHPSTYLGLIFIRFSLAISFHFAARSFLSSLLNTIVFSLDLLSLKGFLFINLGKFFSASCFSSSFPWSGYPFDILLFFPRFNINWLLLTVVFKRV